MDMLSLSDFDNTNDFAGIGGGDLFKTVKLLTNGTPGLENAAAKTLTPAEIIAKNLAQGKPSGSIGDTFKTTIGDTAKAVLPKSAYDTLAFVADPGRWSTVIIGIAFILIAVAAIAFGSMGQGLGAAKILQKHSWRWES